MELWEGLREGLEVQALWAESRGWNVHSGRRPAPKPLWFCHVQNGLKLGHLFLLLPGAEWLTRQQAGCREEGVGKPGDLESESGVSGGSCHQSPGSECRPVQMRAHQPDFSSLSFHLKPPRG